jgi:hypothetical protein
MAHMSKHPDHGMDWDAVESRHRRVMAVSRSAYERWMLTQCGAVLLGLMTLLGWAGYSLAVVKAELRRHIVGLQKCKHGAATPIDLFQHRGEVAHAQRRGVFQPLLQPGMDGCGARLLQQATHPGTAITL